MGWYIDDYYLMEVETEKYIAFNYENLGLYVLRGNEIESKIKRISVSNTCRTLGSDDEIKNLTKLKTLVVCASEECNMACAYCFANKGNYHNKDTARIMKFDEYKKMFTKILDTFKEGIETINFFGGEPLIGFEDMRTFILFVEEICKIKNIEIPLFSFITNGTLLNKKVIDFANEHEIFVTVSIDANEKIHNQYRVYKNGTGSYQTIIKKLEYIHTLKNKRFLLTCESTIGMDFLLSYQQGNIKEYFDAFYELGIDSVITFLVDTNNVITREYEEAIKVFYYDMIDYTFDLITNCNDYQKIPPFILDIIVNIITKRRKRECRVGKTTLFYTIGGGLYPCQMFYQANQDYMGNLYDPDNDIGVIMQDLKKVKRTEIEECKKCFCKNICQSWCEGSVVLNNKDAKSVIETRCMMQKSIVERVIENLVKVSKDRRCYKEFAKSILLLSEKFSVKNLKNISHYREDLNG